jgi:hypothetical protein
MKRKQTFQFKIVRVPIGGEFFNCHPDCSFLKKYCIGNPSCLLTKEDLNQKVSSMLYPLARCNNVVSELKNIK